MKSHGANAFYGAVDYLAYPAGLFIFAPVILHRLGVERFGIWAMANALLMSGAIIASGFGDANIRAVAQARAGNQRVKLVRTVRSALALHLVLGAMCGLAVWVSAPSWARALVKTHSALTQECTWALRFVAVLVLLRAIETVCVSTQRAYCRYGAAIAASVAARIAGLILACVVPLFQVSVAAILAACAALSVVSLCIQWRQLCRLLRVQGLAPRFDRLVTRSLVAFGLFTWLQAVVGLLSGQADRLVAGAALGASAMTVYAFCVQLTQPVYGVTAAALHFVFPLLASRSAQGSYSALRRPIVFTFLINALFVGATLACLLLFGESVLRMWAGASIAAAAHSILPVIAWSTALPALSVTGCYALLALGQPRAVATLGVLGGVAMGIGLWMWVPRFGLQGVAWSRVVPGCIALGVYAPLLKMLHRPAETQRATALSLPGEEGIVP